MLLTLPLAHAYTREPVPVAFLLEQKKLKGRRPCRKLGESGRTPIQIRVEKPEALGVAVM